jgi:hypothetical protein
MKRASISIAKATSLQGCFRSTKAGRYEGLYPFRGRGPVHCILKNLYRSSVWKTRWSRKHESYFAPLCLW